MLLVGSNEATLRDIEREWIDLKSGKSRVNSAHELRPHATKTALYENYILPFASNFFACCNRRLSVVGFATPISK